MLLLFTSAVLNCNMGCDGPDPPDHTPHELTPPPAHQLPVNGIHTDESDEEMGEYEGYEPLPQGPEGVHVDTNSSDDEVEDDNNVHSNIPAIESMEETLSREVWTTPRLHDSIEMNNQRAQEVMSAMANFELPQASIPEWAQSITEEQWKQTLNDRIEKIKSNS